jgi:multiple sugar transport system permease protein
MSQTVVKRGSPPRMNESASRPHAAKKMPRSGRAVPYLFIAAPVAYLAVVIFWPLAREIWLSFTKTKLVNPNGGTLVGWENYEKLFTSSALANSVWITLVYTAGTVLIALVLGVVIAVAVDRPFKGRSAARGILAFGWAVPTVATALIFSWIYNEQSGVLNAILGAVGMEPQKWLTSTDMALWSVLMTTVWQVTPFVMLVVLAALQSVPHEIIEASRVDGADSLSSFRAVTFPHILPAVRLVALLLTVWTIRRFEVIYLLTGGGPVESTNVLVVGLRHEAFENHNLGRAAVYGVVGLLLSLAVTLVYYSAERRATQRSRA